jgi:hypothetical protein
MSDQVEIYVKKNANGEIVERPVLNARDRVAAEFAGFQPKKAAAKSSSDSSTKSSSDSGAKSNASTEKAADAK